MKTNLILILFLIACNSKENFDREILLEDGSKAVGDINKDSTFEGEIKFYDSQNKLTGIFNYHNNLKDGIASKFYNNGKKSISLAYKEGKRNGTSLVYDSLGNLTSSEYHFHGLKVVPVIIYENNKPGMFTFSSFENETLLQFDYSKISRHRLFEKKDLLFFYHIQNLEIFNNEGKLIPSPMIFLYTPKPPIYNFKYKLAVVDSAMRVKEYVKESEAEEHWVHYELPQLTSRYFYAFSLTVIDPNHGTYTAYKKIELDSK